MQIPYFNDFINTLTEEKMREIIRIDIEEDDNVSVDVQLYCSQLLSSVKLLRIYHEWLAEQLCD